MPANHFRMANNVKTRNVSLTFAIEAFINDRVTSGRFRSAGEVVRAALRLPERDERRRKAAGQRDIRRDRATQSHTGRQE